MPRQIHFVNIENVSSRKIGFRHGVFPIIKVSKMQEFTNEYAPGAPGSDPKWNTSKKTGVGTSLNPLNHVWFTTSHGILNEIFYPRVDSACIRDVGLLVSDGKDYFSEEKRDTVRELEYIEEGVPAYKFVNTCKEGRYRIEKEIFVDPKGDTLIQRVRFTALQGDAKDYHLFVLLAPHIQNEGKHNNAWCGSYKGMEGLFAERNHVAIAMLCSLPFKKRSVGYVGVSDAWQTISQEKDMVVTYEKALDGNVAVCGEIDLDSIGEDFFTISIGFGSSANEAAQSARATLLDDYATTREEYLKEWRLFQERVKDFEPADDRRSKLGKKVSAVKKACNLNFFRTSAAVLMAHHSQNFPGGYIASLSIPWGTAKGDEDMGGYHLVWPRDLVETSGGFIAAGKNDEALQILRFLRLMQEDDGHWHQNLWLDGSAYWTGIQLDETAFPIILTGTLVDYGFLGREQLKGYIPMVQKAAAFILEHGPVTDEDRWEENGGYSPFTLASEVTALILAADILEGNGERKAARYLRETADMWNENIETWTYVTGTEKSKKYDVDGYYVRIAPPDVGAGRDIKQTSIHLMNKTENTMVPTADVVSPDVLALVRFGLRRADDPRILNTIKIIDAELKVDTPNGPCWHRYNGDGYGEQEDGAPFGNAGIGRAWPLLTGERAHYEIAAGNFREARKLLTSIQSFSNNGGMISEQVWDRGDIPQRGLYEGRPSGSAMPLVWAHSEYMKLCRSLFDKKVFDLPDKVYKRYVVQNKKSPRDFWRFDHKIKTINKSKKKLRIEAKKLFNLRWSVDGWSNYFDSESKHSGMGMQYVDIDLNRKKVKDQIEFTFYWPEADKWEGNNFITSVQDK